MISVALGIVVFLAFVMIGSLAPKAFGLYIGLGVLFGALWAAATFVMTVITVICGVGMVVVALREV